MGEEGGLGAFGGNSARDAVAAHAVFALLHSLVQAHLLLLGDGVHHHFVVHRGADVALGAPAARAPTGQRGDWRALEIKYNK